MAASSKKRIRVANEGQIFEIEVDDDDADEDETELLHKQGDDLFRWSHKSTMLLIKTRLQMDAEFLNPMNKKSKLWQKIGGIMRVNGFVVEGSRCDDKWRNLLQTYRKIKYRPSKVASTWEYFHILDRVLANAGQARPQRKYTDAMMKFRDLTRPDQKDEVSQLHEYTSDSSCGEEDIPAMNFEGSSGSVSGASNGNVSRPFQMVKGNLEEIPVDPPSWLKYVLDRLDQRDRRIEERENERWNKLMGAIESLQKAEMEKVKALNTLTGTLEQFVKCNDVLRRTDSHTE